MFRRIVAGPPICGGSSGSSLIGATIEWYDFFLYGVVAGIVFNKLYFPNSDPVVSTMLAYTTFAVGFVTPAAGAV